MPIRKVKLGPGLPAFTGEIPAPDVAYLDKLSAQWDEFVPELAGLLDAKPTEAGGSPRYIRDEIKKQTIRVRDGHVVTLIEIRAGYEKYMKAVRG